MSYIGSTFSQQLTTPAVDYFNGNGVTTTFQLTRSVTSVFAVQVVVNNVPQNAREAYGINSSNQIIFTSAPSVGTNNIYVVYDSQIGQTVTPSPGSVTASSLSPGAISQPALDVSLGGGTGAMLLPSGTTAQRPTTPANGMVRYNSTTGRNEIYQNGIWNSFSFTYEVEYLVIAGGGGSNGVGAGFYGSSGGGAGGYRSSVRGELSGGNTSAESPLILISANNYTVTVGAGGAGVAPGSTSIDGNPSSFDAIIALGGGRGVAFNTVGGLGGSGGGGGAGLSSAGGSGTTGQGFAGGTGGSGGTSSAAGGGGAGAVGANGAGNGTVGGAGGAGRASSITGTSVLRAGGGGGGGTYTSGGAGGSGGGGSGGASSPSAGNPGTPNTGGGGGGATSAPSTGGPFGGSGGSGVVIIRYLGSQRGTGGAVTSSGGYTIHTFNSSGTYTA
jgi:hypothetical protein